MLYMNYNCNHVIEYNNMADEELMNDAYRGDFLKCFNCESYNDTIDNTISQIYNETKSIPVFTNLYSQVRMTFSIINQDELCLVYLFSYDYLYLFHNILTAHINNNDIPAENINELICLLQLST
jgi:hypothetical protein